MTRTAQATTSLDKDTLPNEWERVRLGDHVTKVGSGITPRGGQAAYLKSGIPLIRSQNVHMNEFRSSGLAFISSDQDRQMAGSRVMPGDVLLNITGASIGRVCVVPEELCPANVNQHVSIVRPRESLDPQFLSFYISTPDFQEFIQSSQAGATRQALTKTLIQDFSIPLPPLPEQKRIVALLNEQMAAVEKARAAAEAQLEAAQSLDASLLRKTFSNHEAQKWHKVNLGDILKLRKEVVHPRDNPKGHAIFVGLEHIESGTGTRIGSREIEMADLTGRKPRFYRGDIVYGYLRPYLNKVWVAEFDGLCSVDQYVYSVKGRQADTKFVAAFMRSPVFLERAPIDTTPGQLPRIRTEEVASVGINLPTLSGQREIMRSLDRQIAEAQVARVRLAEALTCLERLRAACLRQAFLGGAEYATASQ